MSGVLSGSNALFRYFDLLEALEGKQQFDQVDGWIFAGSPDDGGEGVGDRGMERDSLDHQAGQVEADALVGCECHLSSEFGAWSRKTQVLLMLRTRMKQILRKPPAWLPPLNHGGGATGTAIRSDTAGDWSLIVPTREPTIALHPAPVASSRHDAGHIDDGRNVGAAQVRQDR